MWPTRIPHSHFWLPIHTPCYVDDMSSSTDLLIPIYDLAKHYPLLRNGDKGFEIEIQGVEDPCKHKLNLYFVTSQGTFAPNGHFKLCFILLYCAHKINYTNQMLHLILLKQQTYTFSSYSKI